MKVGKIVSLDSRHGFTLIELSIVLVVIGLILGGVLVGRDLIRASGIRATVGQIEKYNSAINTFRNKFNAIPGDIPQTSAFAFGLFTLTTTPTGMGDGNGLIEGGSSGGMIPLGETLLFWRHLSDANLIDGQLGYFGNSVLVAATGGTTGTVTTINQSLPDSRTTPANSYIVYAVGGLNYYQLLAVSGIAGNVYNVGTTGITPIQSFHIDTKLDDGKPNTGIVLAKGISATPNSVPTFAIASVINTCTIGLTVTSTSSTYNIPYQTGGEDGSCSIRFRFN